MVLKNQKQFLPKLQTHHCFACCTSNTIGLDLSFYYYDNAVCTDITLKSHFCGWENIAHGGIISTILDETMSWAIVYYRRTFFVTRNIEIKFIKPVYITEKLVAKAWIEKDLRGSMLQTSAVLLDLKEQKLAQSTAQFALLPPEKLTMVPDKQKEEMMRVFDLLPPFTE